MANETNKKPPLYRITMIIFPGDSDKIIAGFIIANGAAGTFLYSADKYKDRLNIQFRIKYMNILFYSEYTIS